MKLLLIITVSLVLVVGYSRYRLYAPKTEPKPQYDATIFMSITKDDQGKLAIRNTGGLKLFDVELAPNGDLTILIVKTNVAKTTVISR